MMREITINNSHSLMASSNPVFYFHRQSILVYVNNNVFLRVLEKFFHHLLNTIQMFAASAKLNAEYIKKERTGKMEKSFQQQRTRLSFCKHVLNFNSASRKTYFWELKNCTLISRLQGSAGNAMQLLAAVICRTIAHKAKRTNEASLWRW
jgi:hypothetical protein